MKGSRWTVWMESCRTAITNCTSECLYDCSYCRTEARYSCHSPYVKVSELLLLHMSGSLCQALYVRVSVPLPPATGTSVASLRYRDSRKRGARYRYNPLQVILWHRSGTEALQGREKRTRDRDSSCGEKELGTDAQSRPRQWMRFNASKIQLTAELNYDTIQCRQRVKHVRFNTDRM